MAEKQFDPPNGPRSTPMTKGMDSGAVRQDSMQMKDANMRSPTQMSGTGMTNSPTIAHEADGDGYFSSRIDVAAGSGASPRKPMFPIETSAPRDAHTLGRAPAGWLK
jgi:hypothetical protein